MKVVELMNDPHVESLHYWVLHDQTFSYDGAEPLKCEDDSMSAEIVDEKLIVTLKSHYATEQQAKEAIEPFIRDWEFDAALRYGRGAFQLGFSHPVMIDRNPAPTLAGEARLKATGAIGPVRGTVQLTKLMGSYPAPPSGQLLCVDEPYIQKMLSLLQQYRMHRMPLGVAAYRCLEALRNRAREKAGKSLKEGKTWKHTGNHFAISVNGLKKLAALCNRRGGMDSRHEGSDGDYTNVEKHLLVDAMQSFIHRAAERETWPDKQLTPITLNDLPSLSKE